MELGDKELMECCAKGDKTAREILYRRYCKAAYWTAMRIFGRSDLAQDVMQETFIRAFRGAAGYRGGNIEAWIRRIALHVALNLLRQHKQESFRQESHAGAEDALGTEANYLPSAEHPDEAPSKKEADHLRAALDTLDEKSKEVVLSRNSDLEYAEVAKLVGTTEDHARVLNHRALRKLSAQLSKHFPERSEHIAKGVKKEKPLYVVKDVKHGP